MKIKISKTNGAKNSFIIIYDNKNHLLIKSHIEKICDQFHTDGLLLVSKHKGYDYKMDYFNNDGSWETMCANGARCAALFMFQKKLVSKFQGYVSYDEILKDIKKIINVD